MPTILAGLTKESISAHTDKSINIESTQVPPLSQGELVQAVHGTEMKQNSLTTRHD